MVGLGHLVDFQASSKSDLHIGPRSQSVAPRLVVAITPLAIFAAWARLAEEAEETAAYFCDRRRGSGYRRPARYEAALRLVAQHGNKLGAVVGLPAQRLVRDNDRRSRQCGRRDTIENILRNADAVERVLGIV